MDEDKELIIRRAIFGKQIENFMASEIGRYLVSRADEEALSGYNEIRDVDPNDIKKVRSCQNRIWRGESIKQWLADAVTDGLQALEILEDRECNHGK